MSYYLSADGNWDLSLLLHPEEAEEEMAETDIANQGEVEGLRNEGIASPQQFDVVLSLLKLFILGRISNPIFVLAGEPSVGKSSTIKAIVKILKMDWFYHNVIGLKNERALMPRHAPELHAFLRKRSPKRKLLGGY